MLINYYLFSKKYFHIKKMNLKISIILILSILFSYSAQIQEDTNNSIDFLKTLKILDEESHINFVDTENIENLVLSSQDYLVSGKANEEHTGKLVESLMKETVEVHLTRETRAGGKKAWIKSWQVPSSLKKAAVFTFQINFQKGFYFKCQGKVGGLEIGKGPASGCKHCNTAGSHRLMWKPENGGQSYVYVPDQTYPIQPSPLNKPYNCGAGIFINELKGKFKPGTWQTVEIGVKLNDLNKRNGVLFMKIDNYIKVLNGVVWITAGDQFINNATFNFFWGGGCEGTESKVQVRNVELHEYIN